MSRVNSNITNVSVDDRGSFTDKNDLEAYTVVLSTTAHLFSMLFGGASNISVITAIATRRNSNQSSYILFLILFGACCICNFIWSPMEITDLMFYYYREHPHARFVYMKTACYLLCILLISFTLTFLSVEGIFRLKNEISKLEREIVNVYKSALVLFTSTGLICVLIVKWFHRVNDITISYIITDKCVRSGSVVLIALTFFLVAAVFLVLLLFFIKDVYWEEGRPHLQSKSIKLDTAEFLISKSNVSADIDGGFMKGRSASGTLYPTRSQLLTTGDLGSSSSMGGEDKSHISDLHKSKPTGNRLGFYMAQVLGQRRHTICQIGDARNEEANSISRAKQNNYIRKFSVDIAALQALLKNPKIFRDAPHQSDIDISKKQSADISQVQTSKPLLPRKLICGNLELEKMLETVKIWSRDVRINSLPPPVITVSSDDTKAITGEEDIPKVVQIYQELSHEQNKDSNKFSVPTQKPTTLNSDDVTEHTPGPAAESEVTNSSDTDLESRKMARMTLFLSLTFLLTMMPVLVTEMFSSRLSSHAFINISTWMLAVSTIQTIVYPYLVISGDDVVHSAVRQLKARIKNGGHVLWSHGHEQSY